MQAGGIVRIGRVSLICVLVFLHLGACSQSSDDGPGVSGTIVGGEPMTLELPGVAVRIPADALPAGLDVRLSSGPASSFDADADVGESSLTDVFTIQFSSAETARTPFVIELALPDAFAGNVYGVVRSVGPGASDGVWDTGWQSVAGELDGARSVLSLRVLATPEQMRVLAVTPDDRDRAARPPARGLSRDVAALAQHLLGIGVAQAQAGTADVEAAAQPLLNYGWAVTCKPAGFAGCMAGSARLQELAEIAAESAVVLSRLGFDAIHAMPLSRAGLESTGNIVFTAEAPGAMPDGGTRRYFQIAAVQGLTVKNDDENEEVDGYYDSRLGLFVVDADKNALTVIHEIMHGVQRSVLPAAYTKWGRDAGDWIIEGTASAVETLAPRRPANAPRGRAYRYYRTWRDWTRSLASTQDNDPYEVLEYWLFVDASLGYLKALYSSLQSATATSGLPESAEYEIVQRALGSVAGTQLTESFLDLIADRAADDDYPATYCSFLEATCEADRCPLADDDVTPDAMSARCFDVIVDTEALDCGNPVLEAELRGKDGVHTFLIDAARHMPGDTVSIADRFEFWTINADTAASSGSYAFEEAAIEISARCGGVTIITMQQTSSVSASGSRRSGEWHSQTRDEEFRWEPVLGALGTNERVRRSFDGVNVEEQTSPLTAIDRLESRLEASVPEGARATAVMITTTRNAGEEFVIEGSIDLSVDGSSGGDDPILSASAQASLVLALSVRTPSIIELVNCDLFEEFVLAGQGDLQRAGDNCMLRTAGSAVFETPAALGQPGLSIDYEAILSGEVELPPGLELDDLPPEEFGQFADPLAEFQRMTTAMTGRVFYFAVNADREESSYGAAEQEDLSERFALRIVPDPDAATGATNAR